jgi:hypothetical protein
MIKNLFVTLIISAIVVAVIGLWVMFLVWLFNISLVPLLNIPDATFLAGLAVWSIGTFIAYAIVKINGEVDH